MSQPTTGPADVEVVKVRTKAPDADAGYVQSVVDAVNAVVRGLPVAQLPDPAEGEPAPEWPASIVEGSTMLAVRVYRRKNTPGGVEAFGSDGIAYVRRSDPDIAMLLGLGEWASPAVG